MQRWIGGCRLLVLGRVQDSVMGCCWSRIALEISIGERQDTPNNFVFQLCTLWKQWQELLMEEAWHLHRREATMTARTSDNGGKHNE